MLYTMLYTIFYTVIYVTCPQFIADSFRAVMGKRGVGVGQERKAEVVVVAGGGGGGGEVPG